MEIINGSVSEKKKNALEWHHWWSHIIVHGTFPQVWSIGGPCLYIRFLAYSEPTTLQISGSDHAHGASHISGFGYLILSSTVRIILSLRICHWERTTWHVFIHRDYPKSHTVIYVKNAKLLFFTLTLILCEITRDWRVSRMRHMATNLTHVGQHRSWSAPTMTSALYYLTVAGEKFLSLPLVLQYTLQLDKGKQTPI